MIPHFEKMLYDNGALLASYAEAALATGDALFRHITDETGEWLLREMRMPRPSGAEASIPPTTRTPRDTRASSTSGRARKSQAALTPRSGAFSPPLRLRPGGEFRGRLAPARVRIDRESRHGIPARRRRSANAASTARAPNYWRFAASASGRASTTRSSPAGTRSRSAGWPSPRACSKNRSSHPRPTARSSSCAQPVALVDGGGRLLATSKDGTAHLNAYLDDYAYLADALLEMLQLRWRNDDATWLRDILDAMLAHFEDRETRRLLLHVRRSRGADPSQQELQRRRHPGRQWHRSARVDSRRLSARRDPLARSRGAHVARRVAGAESLSAWPHEPAGSAGRIPRRRRKSC